MQYQILKSTEEGKQPELESVIKADFHGTLIDGNVFWSSIEIGEPLTITGDGEQRRDFTYVGDIVDGLVRCGEALLDDLMDSVNGEIFELGNGGNYSINEIADAFGNYSKEYIETRKGEMRETLNIDNKAQDVLGWKPTVDIKDYIKEKLDEIN